MAPITLKETDHNLNKNYIDDTVRARNNNICSDMKIWLSFCYEFLLVLSCKTYCMDGTSHHGLDISSFSIPLMPLIY